MFKNYFNINNKLYVAHLLPIKLHAMQWLVDYINASQYDANTSKTISEVEEDV